MTTRAELEADIAGFVSMQATRARRASARHRDDAA